MQAPTLIARYAKDGWIDTWGKKLFAAVGQRWHLKGTVGSLDAVLAATLYQRTTATQLFILQDKEEAAYFYSDLQGLLETDRVLLYPVTHHQPYTQVHPDDANQLMRTTVWHRLYMPDHLVKAPLIVTYPAALAEKVVSKEDFLKHTWVLKVKQVLSMNRLTEWLLTQNFEQTDFVYEVGQFSIRGGIIDVFSAAYRWPIRIVCWGDIIECIRMFDPENQCSLEDMPKATMLSHVTTSSSRLASQSLLASLPSATPVWIKDQELILAALEKRHSHATQVFQEKSGTEPSQDLVVPDLRWETPDSWLKTLAKFTTVEFGKRFYQTPHTVITCEASAQPSFNQNMALLAEDLYKNQVNGLENFIVAESENQFERLQNLLTTHNTAVHFQALSLGLRQGFIDHRLGIACYTDHQLFNRYHRYKSPKKYAKARAITLRELKTFQPGDYVVHMDYGIGRFAGLHHKTLGNGQHQEVVRLIYKNDDLVYIGLQSLHKLTKYTSKEGVVPTITKLGTSAWSQKKQRVKSKIKDIAKELLQLYSQRKEAMGFSFSPDNTLHAALASSFMYEDTPDQVTATAAVTKDMEASYPMDRLLCGDVGFGKTEVAIRAAFKAVHDQKQVAVLVPTTILALQHYHAFCKRLACFGVRVAYVNRFKTAQEVNTVLAATAVGEVQILIGTHRLLSPQIKFHDLGLLIIDEEQKFGVQAKDRLKQLRIHVDVLTLTATPIPRTLHFSLMGARDLSLITTPPINRQPIDTLVRTFDTTVIQDAISYELQRGGQVFFVHNRVGDIEEIAHIITKLVPDGRVGIAHGQIPGKQLEYRMLQFVEGAYDILVTTSIIEAGLDIPNVNTILINNSHLFGLSDLHQMRGRTGRSDRKAFCYLLSPPTSTLTAEARRRLSAIEEFSDLGDGFKVAMRDLDIRGAGNLLGAEQSGFIADVGFETYCKLLEEAVQELKEGLFQKVFTTTHTPQASRSPVQDCTVETDLEAFIPITYVSSGTERIHLYMRLDQLKDNTALIPFEEELKDRFGPLPLPVQTLIKLVELRSKAQQLGFTKLKLKNETMQCYLTSRTHAQQEDTVTRIVAYVQKHPHRCQMHTVKTQLVLTVRQIPDVQQASTMLAAL